MARAARTMHSRNQTSALTQGSQAIQGVVGWRWHLSRGFFIEHLGVLAVFAQVVLACVVARQADLLAPQFRRVLALAAVGFVVHHAVPVSHRMKAFAALCVSALVLVFGGSSSPWSLGLGLMRAGVLVAVGALLVGICHLRVGFWVRAALLASVGGATALLRTNRFGVESLIVVWPILAGLFMFRLIVYLYETSTMKSRPALPGTFAYFLLLPNICSGLFPVIGFKALQRSHYPREPLVIYQRGARLIVRGLIHLLLYRVTQQLFGLRPEDVASGSDLIQFVLVNALLYLKVSGQFHLFIGTLALFGFDLPDANNRYFLASSFTDYWRRVNIYWKEFILSVFYYPAYFRLRSLGGTWALVLATLWAFAVTWVLHLYQTFWLKGAVSITWPDIIFWSTLALLVLLNSLWEMRRGRLRKLGTGTYSMRSAVGLVLRTAATFACVSLLWSLWSSPTVSLWLGLWRFADATTLAWGLVALGVVMAATVWFEVLPSVRAGAREVTSRGGIGRSAAASLGLLLVAAALTNPRVQAFADSPALTPWVDAINTGDSMLDDLVVRNGGYYENLMDADQANARVWEMINRRPMPYQYAGQDPVRRVRDFRFRELIPNTSIEAYDTHIDVNRWGMRDEDYSPAKPRGTLRIALLGSSHTMGWGVAKHQTFEAVVEERLNAWASRVADGARLEILNFSMNGLSPLGQVPALEKTVARFDPDIVLLVTHTVDTYFLGRDVPRSLRLGIPREPFLDAILRQARVSARTHELIAQERMKPFEGRILRWSYERVAERIRALGAVPLALHVPLPSDLPIPAAESEALIESAEAAGFTVIDFSHVFDDHDPESLMLPEGWHHSNVTAHALVADALYEHLIADPRVDLVNQVRRTVSQGRDAATTVTSEQ